MNWIEILRAGDYAQGKITSKDLQEISESYNPALLQAMFIPEHRMFNEKGELLNNMSALGWVLAVKHENDSLFVMPEEASVERLRWYFDGHTYRYCSAELQEEEVNGEKKLYLAAVVPTNFPASKMAQIKLNDKKAVKTFSIEISNNKKGKIMDNEKFIQLCKILDIPETSTADQVIAKLTELKTASGDNQVIADAVAKLEGAIKLTSQDDQIVKLTEKVTELENRLTSEELPKLVDQAITDKKLMPSQRADMLTQFNGKIEEFKAFSAKLPVLNINSTQTPPASTTPDPLKYSDLLKDVKKFNDIKANNPELFNQLRTEHYNNLTSMRK